MKMRFETRAIHVGEEPNLQPGGSGDVVVPIHLASTFARRETDKPTSGYEYSRTANPTRAALEKRLAALEDAKFALAFASGMAAETVLLLTLLKPGDHVILSDDLYGGTKRLCHHVFQENFKIGFSHVDLSRPEDIRDAIKRNTKLIWIETPTNPLMKICDIKAVSKIARKKSVLVVVDNTFMTPYFQQPLKLGADVVVHSTTKYLNGHSDSVGGCIILSSEEIHEKLRFNQNALGAILSPFDSYLVLRGVKTLAVRMEKHNKNAMTISSFLEKSRKVKKVLYPGLENHPQHELAKKQASGFGGMISFEVYGGLRGARRFLESLKIFSLAESLGGVESLAEHPASMTHSSIPKKERERIGISDSLIRLSVGIEDIADLKEDIHHALGRL